MFKSSDVTFNNSKVSKSKLFPQIIILLFFVEKNLLKILEHFSSLFFF